MMGVRMPEGVPIEKLKRLMNAGPEDLFGGKKLSTLQSEGLLERTACDIRVTAEGMPRLDAVLRHLFENWENGN